LQVLTLDFFEFTIEFFSEHKGSDFQHLLTNLPLFKHFAQAQPKSVMLIKNQVYMMDCSIGIL